jgi:FkbH-like protein
VEDVRLVIWDLDETFWRGTLTEGGITEYRQDNHDLVIELARRGIVSSICSKNDLSTVRKILVERGLWDYFVFPSINWEPKGGRIHRIIESVQLRAPTVLFIDDNPMNLADAADHNPGLQVAGEGVLESLIHDKRLRGKDDSGLSRLSQYKILEKKNADRAEHPNDSIQFLRDSGIVVSTDYDVAGNIDRAIELINRTNQLNFTKLRLPDEANDARKTLTAELGKFDTVAGLVKVADRYGDYGYCGFYLITGHWGYRRLLHYCFSCRVLGMGVEQWLYDRLGRPEIRIVGEVLSELKGKVDWIEISSTEHERAISKNPVAIDEIRLRGGCDLEVLADYFRLDANHVQTELVRWQGHQVIRFDTSSLLVLGLDDLDAETTSALAALGLPTHQIKSAFLARPEIEAAIILNITGDAISRRYRHKAGGFVIPIDLGGGLTQVDITKADSTIIDNVCVRLKMDSDRRTKFHQTIELIKRDYDFLGLIEEREIKANLRSIFARIPNGAVFFMLLPNDAVLHNGEYQTDPNGSRLRRAILEASSGNRTINIIDLNEFAKDPSSMRNGLGHFDRAVYLKLRQAIKDVIHRRRECDGSTTTPKCSICAYSAPC